MGKRYTLRLTSTCRSPEWICYFADHSKVYFQKFGLFGYNQGIPESGQAPVAGERFGFMTLSSTQVVSGAMAAGGPGAIYDPVQIQKLLFLVDREIPEEVGGPHFRFVPYHYGPFDEKVYGILQLLERKGQVTVDRTGAYPCYALTDLGLKEGLGILRTLAPAVSHYLTQAADWVRRLSFSQLLRDIYARYPDMATNSRLPHLARAAHSTKHHSALHVGLLGASSVLNLMGPYSASVGTSTAEEALAEDWRKVGNDLRKVLGYVQG